MKLGSLAEMVAEPDHIPGNLLSSIAKKKFREPFDVEIELFLTTRSTAVLEGAILGNR